MGQHQSVITSSSDKGLPSLYYYGPDGKTILKRSRKGDDKVIGVIEEVEECVSKKRRCSNSASDGLSPSMIPEDSVAPSSPHSGNDSSQFVPNSDSLPLAEVSFSPPSPRKIVMAPFTDMNRRRSFLQLPGKEDSVVPIKKAKEAHDAIKAEPQDPVYDSTPVRARPEQDRCRWKTPEPIATSTPIHAAVTQSRVARSSSVPRVVSPTPETEAVDLKPDLNICKAPEAQASTALPAIPPRTASLEKSATERGFAPRRLPLPNGPQFPMNPMQMMQMMCLMQQQMMKMHQQHQKTMNQPQQMMNQPQQMNPPLQMINQPQQMNPPHQMIKQPQQNILNQQQQQMLQMQQMMNMQLMMMKQQQVVPQQAIQKEEAAKAEVVSQVVPERSLPSSGSRSLCTPLANPGPLRSPLPKSAISRRPVFPQMGVTPRKVKQRRTTVGLGVTEKMYGSIDVPMKKPPQLPILTNPKDVSGFQPRKSVFHRRRKTAMPTKPDPPMYTLPSSAGYSFGRTMSPIRGVPSERSQAIFPPLPSYAQMFPSGGAQQNFPPTTGQYHRYGQLV